MSQNNQNTFATRLKLARKMAGMSLQDLSDALVNTVTKQALNKYEEGLMNPTNSVFMAIAKALNLKPDYFLRKRTLELGQVNFRKRTSLSKKDEEAIIERVRDYVERYQELEDILGIEQSFVNPLSDFQINCKGDIEAAAKKLRQDWNLGDKPIANIAEMLELKNIKVILINYIDSIDGFAVFTSTGTPVIVVNEKDKSIERVRFTIVHELAHLLLNLSIIEADDKQVEEWCHYFSTNFLIPGEMLIKMIGGNRTYINISELITIKEYYGISIRAIVYRLKQLGLISDNYYQRWNIYMSKTYGQKKEPGNYKGQEESRGFKQLIGRALSEDIISLSKAASLYNVDIENLRKEFL